MPDTAPADGKLSAADIEEISGIPRTRPTAQRNRLRRWGIKAEINARREVVCFWSWVGAAALPGEQKQGYAAAQQNSGPADIGMNLRALHGQG